MIPIALLALEVPCAVSVCPGPTGHDDVLLQSVVRLLADGTAWYCRVQFSCCGPVSVIEEANIHVLRRDGNLEGWEMGGIFNTNWACTAAFAKFSYPSLYL